MSPCFYAVFMGIHKELLILHMVYNNEVYNVPQIVKITKKVIKRYDKYGNIVEVITKDLNDNNYTELSELVDDYNFNGAKASLIGGIKVLISEVHSKYEGNYVTGFSVLLFSDSGSLIGVNNQYHINNTLISDLFWEFDN